MIYFKSYGLDEPETDVDSSNTRKSIFAIGYRPSERQIADIATDRIGRYFIFKDQKIVGFKSFNEVGSEGAVAREAVEKKIKFFKNSTMEQFDSFLKDKVWCQSLRDMDTYPQDIIKYCAEEWGMTKSQLKSQIVMALEMGGCYDKDGLSKDFKFPYFLCFHAVEMPDWMSKGYGDSFHFVERSSHPTRLNLFKSPNEQKPFSTIEPSHFFSGNSHFGVDFNKDQFVYIDNDEWKTVFLPDGRKGYVKKSEMKNKFPNFEIIWKKDKKGNWHFSRIAMFGC